MSYILKQNNQQIAISGGWNPNLLKATNINKDLYVNL